MKNVVFFNYAHKGDVFLSRPFIEHIMKFVDAQFFCAHYWGEYLLKDLDLKYTPLDQMPKVQNNNEHAHNFVSEDTVYINTWIGKYASLITPGYCECNLKTLYTLVYSEVFEFVNKIFDVNLKLKDIHEYFPSVEYSRFNTSNIDNFLKEDTKKKILLCNGPALSGQCEYNGDMVEIIDFLSAKYPDISFITTHKIDLNRDSVKYTGDIIKSDGSDLNEISYLSKFCDIIVGRSSGPFVFSNTKENIL